MEKITAQELRNIISELISPAIQLYRESKKQIPEEGIFYPEASDDEIDDFLFSNPYFDGDLVGQLTDPGLLGFWGNIATIHGDWKKEFIEKINLWAISNEWLYSQEIKFINAPYFEPDDKEVWTPETIIPAWLTCSPSYLLIARQILDRGGSLKEIHHRDFEKLLGELLEQDGWQVKVTRGSKDGGIDIIANKTDPLIGEIKTIWQAKRYIETNKVSLSAVRELSAIREKEEATKGIIVTTSKLTSGAIQWIQRDQYRLGYLEGNQIEEWILGKKLSLL